MSRYIDEKDVYKLVEPHGVERVHCSQIDELPRADVVEVVRCDKCKHLSIINSREVYAKCRMTDLEFKPFDIDTRKHFCSYGERREE